MSGFTNPAGLIRSRLLAGSVKPRSLNRNYLRGFLGIEITFIIIMFAVQKDPFRYFCSILGCTPIGGLAGTAEGMGECIGRGESLHAIMRSWLYDYGHWLTCSLQYYISLYYLKITKELGYQRLGQFFQAMIFTLFSGILLLAFSSTCINGPTGLIANIWNAYMREETRGTDNPYFLVFIIMWITIFIFVFLGCCCLMDHLNSFFKYACIMGAIWLALLGLILVMGYRVLRGIGTYVENGIIKIVWPAFGNPFPLYWLAFIMLLMLISMTSVKALNDTDTKAEENEESDEETDEEEDDELDEE